MNALELSTYRLLQSTFTSKINSLVSMAQLLKWKYDDAVRRNCPEEAAAIMRQMEDEKAAVVRFIMKMVYPTA